MKREIPETYSLVETVRTDFGVMPVPVRKGEGGTSALSRRLADNFYNKFMR